MKSLDWIQLAQDYQLLKTDSAPCRASGKIWKIEVVRCTARINFIGAGKETIPYGQKCNTDACEGTLRTMTAFQLKY